MYWRRLWIENKMLKRAKEKQTDDIKVNISYKHTWDMETNAHSINQFAPEDV